MGQVARGCGTLLLTLFLIRCGGGNGEDDGSADDEDETSETLCEPEEEEPCECSSGQAGVRVCLQSGFGWGSCQCDAEDGADGTSDEAGSEGEDEGGGSSGEDSGTDGGDDPGSDGDSEGGGETDGSDGDPDSGTESDGSDGDSDGGGESDDSAGDTGGDSGSEEDSGTEGDDSDGEDSGDGGTGTDIGLAIVGEYIDENGFDHDVTSRDWTTVFALYYVHAYDNGEHWAILFNDPVSWTYPFRWSRFEWEWSDDGRFWYCPVTVSAETREEVETIERPDHDDPANGGCNDEPWIELRPR